MKMGWRNLSSKMGTMVTAFIRKLEKVNVLCADIVHSGCYRGQGGTGAWLHPGITNVSSAAAGAGVAGVFVSICFLSRAGNLDFYGTSSSFELWQTIKMKNNIV